MTFQEFCADLESKIQATYLEGLTVDQAEQLAAEFLAAQIKVSAQLSRSDLDARMRKAGLKAVRASVYGDVVGKSDKRPTVDALDHAINENPLVNGEQNGLDKAEVERDELKRLYDIFGNAHIYYRGVAKGRFD